MKKVPSSIAPVPTSSPDPALGMMAAELSKAKAQIHELQSLLDQAVITIRMQSRLIGPIVPPQGPQG